MEPRSDAVRARWSNDGRFDIQVRLDAGDVLLDQTGPVDLSISADPLDPYYAELIRLAVPVEDPLQQARPKVSPIISKRQFYQAMAELSEFTQQEALAAVRTGTLPPKLANWISGRPAN